MKETNLTFFEYFEKRRVQLGYTLRKFCRNKGYDPAYISRLENGLIPPPEDSNKLKALAIAIELEKDTPEWVNFFDLAAASQGKFPKDLSSNPKLVNLLPAFYRTLRRKNLTEQDINKLLKHLAGKEDIKKDVPEF